MMMGEERNAKPSLRQIVEKREIATIFGERVEILPDPERLIHLQFNWFAGCAGCNLHLHSMAKQHDEIVAAGICEVAVYGWRNECLNERTLYS